MTFYTILEDFDNYESLAFIDKGFESIIINKYLNLELNADAMFDIVAYEIEKYYPIRNHEEYIKKIFKCFNSQNSDINSLLSLVDAYSQYSNNTEYKQTLYQYMKFQVATVFEHIKLFDLHRKMFDTKKDDIINEEQILLAEINNKTSDCFELFCIGISYYQLHQIKIADQYIQQGLEIFARHDDINLLSNIINKTI